MSARDGVLARVRGALRHEVAHPGAFEPARMDSGWERFASTLTSVGGEPVGPVESADLRWALSELCADAGRVVTGPGVTESLGPGPWEELPEGVSPQSLADVAVALLRGSIGVAENGAVALDGRHAPVRAYSSVREIASAHRTLFDVR